MTNSQPARNDLLDAEAFWRRRLTRALITGSTAESTLPRPTRLLAWSAVLAALVLLTALALRVLHPIA